MITTGTMGGWVLRWRTGWAQSRPEVHERFAEARHAVGAALRLSLCGAKDWTVRPHWDDLQARPSGAASIL